ncbi:unnamed protein product [marine sediment metagenome]|uniref:Uncharacterized protein n=1 Tax=marine sediment metagenome TaxID=412755 RepID=X1D2Z3_9ZZZZ
MMCPKYPLNGYGTGIKINDIGSAMAVKILCDDKVTPALKRKKRKSNLEGRLTYIEIKEMEKEWNKLGGQG